MQVADQAALIAGQLDIPRPVAFVQAATEPLEDAHASLGVFLVGLEALAGAVDRPFDRLQVGQRQLRVDDLDVRKRIQAARHVHNVVVLETADDMGDGVCLANVRQELVAEPLPFRSTGHQPGDVHEFHGGGDNLLRLGNGGQLGQPRIRHLDDADIGVDRAERIILRGDFRTGQRVEQGRLAHVGQPHDAALKAHFPFPCAVPSLRWKGSRPTPAGARRQRR